VNTANPKILALDTSTELCSAALLIGSTVLARELETERGHAEHILPMVDALLAEAGFVLRDLDAIAFGRGPGGFTGVRLAASVTQGLAFGARLPVIAVSDLAAVAQRAFDLDPQAAQMLVCNDARMQEVYWGCFERSANGLAVPIGVEQVSPPSLVRAPTGAAGVLSGAGRGFRAYPMLRALVGQVHEDLLPRAVEIARLAVMTERMPPEQAIPVYLRDDVARPPS
jgi:tRNA threonylcarbamoyladenosine biosynthesis protein TsaB